jgi:hypothetical protein
MSKYERVRSSVRALWDRRRNIPMMYWKLAGCPDRILSPAHLRRSLGNLWLIRSPLKRFEVHAKFLIAASVAKV